MIIAIDGPAAAGKGILAKRLAQHFGLALMDTGLIYRAVGMNVVRAGGDPKDAEAATAAAEKISAEDLEAGVVDGRTLTSYPSLTTDLRNAGATWVDEEVVVDEGLVSIEIDAGMRVGRSRRGRGLGGRFAPGRGLRSGRLRLRVIHVRLVVEGSSRRHPWKAISRVQSAPC